MSPIVVDGVVVGWRGDNDVDYRAQRSYFAGATSTLFNEAAVAADEVNTTTVEDDGTINVIGEVTYQLYEKTAIGGRIGVIAPDFDLNDSPVLFDFGILHAKSNKLDFGARIGFRNLDEAAGTFNITFFTSLRI